MHFRDYIDLVETFNWDETTLLFELFDVEKFINRAKAVQQLIIRGATEGERDGAKLAMDRLVARAENDLQELSPQDQAAFRRRFDAIRAETTVKAEPARARRPFYNEEPPKPRRDQGDADAEYARRSQSQSGGNGGFGGNSQSTGNNSSNSTGGNSSNNKSTGNGFKVHRYAEFREGTSDKVYGIASKDDKFYTFWGRNGASLASKEQDNYSTAFNIFETKVRKGYREVNVNPHIEREIARNLKF